MWAILQWVGILSGERTPECLFFCVFFFNTHPAIFTWRFLGGFSSSFVAPLLISAQQKKHAIRAIIVAAACFLAVQRQLRLHPGWLVKGAKRGVQGL